MDHIRNVKYISRLLDNKFKILGFSFGIDPILGLIPGLGDIVAGSLSFYLIIIAVRAKLPARVLFLMVGNVIIDLTLGFIPIVGDAVDFFYKSNSRNLKLLERHMVQEASLS